ncbi:MAG: tRNA preQ1(34) S-adenosylmethionine ribosyltransferase-isomerase QueA [Alphaproteobacteria bacterium]|nr:tRNA preQ1(34) S-adenosylmethionine ribosyltransferase-isomerase QueA [Alphaproteobacteria bacterium]
MTTNDIAAFDFDLPESLIALRPAQPRDAARLLHIRNDKDTFGDNHIRDLLQFLKAGDALVVNVTKVIPARLNGVRHRKDAQAGETSGAKVEITLTERLEDTRWQCFLKPARRVGVGDKIIFDDIEAQVISRDGRSAELLFDVKHHEMEAVLARLGAAPLPPYIAARRAPDAQDKHDYQTIYAKIDGAIAAPTAGLHFTPELLSQLQAAGVEVYEVVLHIGAGTFLPIEVADISTHKMHGEWGQITAEVATALNEVRGRGSRLVCVGTTALRLLETAANPDGTINPYEGVTDIFITPGCPIRAVDMLLTNFHLPRSTLFMLVCAFSGYDKMCAAYAHAIDNAYRFYSYGDACLLERA